MYMVLSFIGWPSTGNISGQRHSLGVGTQNKCKFSTIDMMNPN
jgi:hypothetical protein